jgi:hypothetical protein
LLIHARSQISSPNLQLCVAYLIGHADIRCNSSSRGSDDSRIINALEVAKESNVSHASKWQSILTEKDETKLQEKYLIPDSVVLHFYHFNKEATVEEKY